MSDMPPSQQLSGASFLEERFRLRQETRQQEHRWEQHLEETVRAPLRELRVEWDAAWTELARAVTPVFRGWQTLEEPEEPDPTAIAQALHRVGRAILRRDEIGERVETTPGLPNSPPRALAARLEWVEQRRRCFTNEPPVLATALVRLGTVAEPAVIADHVRMLLSEADDVPAFGWLPFIPACLWPKDGVFPNPIDPVEDPRWPDHRRVTADDMRRLQYLLWPTARPSGVDRLFPESRIELPPPIRPTPPTPTDRVRVFNVVERTLASVPDPYPSGTKAEQEVAQVRWQLAHGQKSLYEVASEWKKQFADLSVNLHATLKHSFPPARTDEDDLAAVVRELLERGVRIWEAEWLFAIFRNGNPVSMPKREEAANWSVYDGQWVSETLQQMLYSTPERFARFQDAVRQVVGKMLDAEPYPTKHEQMSESNAAQPEPRPPVAAAEKQLVALPAVVKNWLTAQYLADPTPTKWLPKPDSACELVVFVRYEMVAHFLLNQNMDVLSNMNRWTAAGLIADVMVELTPSPDPGDAPPAGVARLRLPFGRHRLVGILRSALDAPVEPLPSLKRDKMPASEPGPSARQVTTRRQDHQKNEIFVPTAGRFPTPAGTSWAEVTLTVGNEWLTVAVGDVRRRFTHSEVGFANRKANGKPDRVWTLLCTCAAAGGVVPDNGKRGGVNKNVKQAVSDLRSRLRAIMGLKGDPMPHNRRDREYRVAFRLRSESPATFVLPDGQGWDAVAITARADGLIEVSVDGTGHADGFDERASVGGEYVAGDATTAWTRRVPLTALGLATDGVPTPEGEALLSMLRGGGKVEAKPMDPAFLKLGKVLTTAFQTQKPAFDYRGGKWVAKFTADSHAYSSASSAGAGMPAAARDRLRASSRASRSSSDRDGGQP